MVLAQIAAISLIGSRRREALRAEARARFARGGPAFAVAIPDIDHIRLVNDRFGHAMGDAVRRTFGQAMSEAPGSADRVARQGGGEFLLLLSWTGEDVASLFARADAALDRAPADGPNAVGLA